jgi:hypothetical protein
MKNFQKSLFLLFLFWIVVNGSGLVGQDKIPTLTVDVSRQLGPFKPLHGVNGGPWVRNGSYDLSPYFKEIQSPYIRLHDVPYACEGAVDIHYIFPDFDADVNDPASYHFYDTDEYIKSIIELGSEVIFRLGESIEHAPKKRHIHPPADMKKWAQICCNIVRHYNDGWADGYHWNIRYWEIWNEPENPPCWTGTWQQYCELYEHASLALKKLDPTLKVGGPAMGEFQRKHGPDVHVFLKYVQDRNLPLDFFSWHGYKSSPDKMMEKIEAGFDILKQYGLQDIETHYTEWNLVTSWGSKTDFEFNKRVYAKKDGPAGAAFTASVIAYMQESELDLACYYSAFPPPFRFRLFDIYLTPIKPFYVFKAMNQLVRLGTRVAVTGNKRETGLGIIASFNEDSGEAAVLLSNFEDETSRYSLEMRNLQVKNSLLCSEYVLDEDRDLELDREQIFTSPGIRIVVELPKETVRLLVFKTRAEKPGYL